MRPICLVGLPGAGKSVVGKALAKRVGGQFFDVDEEIEKLIPGTIKQFFESMGEDSFRALEKQVLKGLCCSVPSISVISTGGGAVLSEANRQMMRERSTVVYLCASTSELVRRLRYDTRRPLLQGGQLSEKLARLFEERDPLYREVAHFVIETGRPSVQTLVSMILMQLELAGCIESSRVPSVIDPPVGLDRL